MKETALNFVKRLLVRRLEGSGVPALDPDLYFHCEAAEPEPFSGGTQVRVKTWKHWSNGLVKLDGMSGEVLAYRVEAHANPPSKQDLEKDAAVAQAAALVAVPPGAVVDNVRQFEWRPHHWVTEVQWIHVEMGRMIRGDVLRVVFHPVTKKVVEIERYWRSPRQY
jgi:hypothetical protein